MKSILAHLILITCVFSGIASAAKISEVRTIEGISEYSLDNGLQVLLFPDESKDTITVNVTYRVGSKHENYGETGMAHLLEHLLFKGTKKHPDIAKELSDHGAQANGTTWLERTNYYETFKASADNLDWALSMEADRMVNSFVAKSDLDSEMTVVRNEFERGENSPWRILLQRIYATAFDWHNYGNSTIGARADIENVKIENLKAFYKKYYQPDNATLTVAGKINKAETLKRIKKYFGKIKKPSRQLKEFYTTDPVQDGERSVTLRRVGGEQVVAAAYRIPSGTHEDFAAISILASILGDSPSGRLHKSLIENQLATAAWAWANQQKDASLLYFNASVDINTDLNKTEIALLDTLERITKTPISEEEVERAKRKLLKNIELAFNSSQTISINLSEWIGIGDWRMLFINRDRLESVSLEDVQRVANHYLVPSNRTLGKFIPTDNPVRAEIPESNDIASIVEGYKGKKEIKQGEVFDATLENISAREIRREEGGTKITSVPIKTRGESVFFELRLGIGNEESLHKKATAVELMGEMLARGTDRFSREELQDEFDKLKAQGGFRSDQQAIYASYETTRENLPRVVSLVHEILSSANFPKKEFELLKAQKLSKLTSDSTDPQALGFSTIMTKLNTHPSGHIHAAQSLTEKLQQVSETNLKDIKELYKSHMGSDDLHIGIAGDFDQESIYQQIFRTFSGWENKTPYSRVAKKYADISPLEEIIETPDKKNSLFVAGVNLDMQYTDDDAPALYIVTRILGGGFLNSRLATRIRQNDGLSYGVGAFLRLKIFDQNGRFFAYAISAPENTEKVHQAFFEEMQRAYDDGFKKEEMDAAIEGLLDQAKVQRSNNQTLAQTIRDLYNDDFSLLKEKDIHDRIRALTIDDLNSAMKKYLDPKRMTIVKAGDFSKVK